MTMNGVDDKDIVFAIEELSREGGSREQALLQGRLVRVRGINENHLRLAAPGASLLIVIANACPHFVTCASPSYWPKSSAQVRRTSCTG